MRVLLITPPMVQINAPYPATAYLAGGVQQVGHEAIQKDASLDLALRLFSRTGLRSAARAMRRRKATGSVLSFLRLIDRYLETIDPTLAFLQGHKPELGNLIRSRRYLPEGPRFGIRDASVRPAARLLSRKEQAVHLASLYLDDIADALHEGVDPRFELARYGERLAASASRFDALQEALRAPPSFVDRHIETLAKGYLSRDRPDLVVFTIPFPGNLYSALRMAACMKRVTPGIPIALGGGYINTELRNMTDPRPFDYVDYIVIDGGTDSLLGILEDLPHRAHPSHPRPALRHTLICRRGKVRHAGRPVRPPPRLPLASPDLAGLPLGRYIPLMEDPNPMQRIWSSRRWNKIVLAEGCYWHRCAFCDTSLEYIGRFRAQGVDQLSETIRRLIKQTGSRDFHFVDEAMPPALLRRLSTALLDQNLRISWWGNIRFDPAFTSDLSELMARAGCLAVTGGLEAPEARLLTLLDKGFTLPQATRTIRHFEQAGMMVHAYLMYGCPTETLQETIDALEYIRQMFESGLLHSAYWHRFALTVHSPFFRNARALGLRLPRIPRATFARNEVVFKDPRQSLHDASGPCLRKALYNFMHGVGLDHDLASWFPFPVPPPTIPTDYVAAMA